MRNYRITTIETDIVFCKGYKYATDEAHLRETLNKLGKSVVRVERQVERRSIIGSYKEWKEIGADELQDISSNNQDMHKIILVDCNNTIVYQSQSCRRNVAVGIMAEKMNDKSLSGLNLITLVNGKVKAVYTIA